MPIQKCQIDNKPGFKWGKQGKCYEYEPGNEASQEDAKKKAIAQGVAIGDFEALAANVAVVRGTYKFDAQVEELAGGIGFDFDGTLSTRKGKQLWQQVGGDWVITARNQNSMPEVWRVTDLMNIPRDRVYAAGSNARKIAKVKELGLTAFYDNNTDVIKALPGVGKVFRP